MKDEELRPCPFCGKDAAQLWNPGTSKWTVECYDGDAGCMAEICRQTEEEAVAAWNTRPALLEAATRTRALEDHLHEQIIHAETRIQDGKDLGASVWRIALEDIVRENRAALTGETHP